MLYYVVYSLHAIGLLNDFHMSFEYNPISNAMNKIPVKLTKSLLLENFVAIGDLHNDKMVLKN